jgi:hypothetical protein
MDVANYYVTTLTNAFGKLGPWVIFIVVGYLVFIKLPFLFMVKVNKENKSQDTTAVKDEAPSLSSPDLNMLAGAETKKNEQKFQEHRQQQQQHQQQKQKKQQQRQQRPPKKETASASSAEELFGIKAGQSFSKQELKDKYHKLLKMNHPDKVNAMGADFKNLAEKKTKDINSAYQELKKKAS